MTEPYQFFWNSASNEGVHQSSRRAWKRELASADDRQHNAELDVAEGRLALTQTTAFP
jgi:hypothetical protein